MKRSDLRSGNYVHCPKLQEFYCQIYSIGHYDQEAYLTDTPHKRKFQTDHKNIEPIPFTSKNIRLDCILEQMLEVMEMVELFIGEDNKHWFFIVKTSEFKIEYFHQLQNWYHGVTGKELMITPPNRYSIIRTHDDEFIIVDKRIYDFTPSRFKRYYYEKSTRSVIDKIDFDYKFKYFLIIGSNKNRENLRVINSNYAMMIHEFNKSSSLELDVKINKCDHYVHITEIKNNGYFN